MVYFIDKPLKIHDLKLMDVFAELSQYEMVMFKKEYEINIGEDMNYRVDAVVILKIDGRYIPIMIEIDYTHFTNIKKIHHIVFDYELTNKVKLIFIVVKLDQPYKEVITIPDKNKYFILPWDLDGIDTIVPLLLGLAIEE